MWSIPEPNSGCWLWLGTLDKKGYGVLSVGGKKAFAHRISLKVHGVHMKPSEWALHHCDNPCCVNPEHLYPGSNADNVEDRVRRGRGLAGSRNTNSKLTERQVIEMRSLEETSIIVAAKYGVSTNTVRRVRGRYGWMHI
jgi:hypothetical protein